MKIQLFILIAVLLASPAFAYDPKEGTGMKLPRFASLKSDNAYVRTGPSMDYPIKWIYKKPGLPVEIIQEFDAWRKIKDPQGETGWVHKLLLSGKRMAVITSHKNISAMREEDGQNQNGQAAFQLEPGVVVHVEACAEKSCLIESPPYEGWIEKKNLWGVYGDEVLN